MTHDYENNLNAAFRNKLLGKLEKVMNLADDSKNTSEEEVAAATERMLALLDKLGLDEAKARAEIEHTKGERQTVKIVSEQIAWLGDVRTTWEMHLSQAVAEGCNCELVWHKQGASLIGTEIDTAAGSFLWGQLSNRLDEMSQTATTQHAREMKAKLGKSAYKSMGQAYFKRYRRNWLAGATDALYRRLVQRKQLVDNEVKALMVKKNQLITQKMVEMFPKLRFITPKQVNSHKAGRAEGFRAGESMSIHKALEAKQSKGLFLDTGD